MFRSATRAAVGTSSRTAAGLWPCPRPCEGSEEGSETSMDSSCEQSTLVEEYPLSILILLMEEYCSAHTFTAHIHVSNCKLQTRTLSQVLLPSRGSCTCTFRYTCNAMCTVAQPCDSCTSKSSSSCGSGTSTFPAPPKPMLRLQSASCRRLEWRAELRRCCSDPIRPASPSVSASLPAPASSTVAARGTRRHLHCCPHDSGRVPLLPAPQVSPCCCPTYTACTRWSCSVHQRVSKQTREETHLERSTLCTCICTIVPVQRGPIPCFVAARSCIRRACLRIASAPRARIASRLGEVQRTFPSMSSVGRPESSHDNIPLGTFILESFKGSSSPSSSSSQPSLFTSCTSSSPPSIGGVPPPKRVPSRSYNSHKKMRVSCLRSLDTQRSRCLVFNDNYTTQHNGLQSCQNSAARRGGGGFKCERCSWT